ncbi:hypothetical protein OROGR_000611 [Orobanche gracilis]
MLSFTPGRRKALLSPFIYYFRLNFSIWGRLSLTQPLTKYAPGHMKLLKLSTFFSCLFWKSMPAKDFSVRTRRVATTSDGKFQVATTIVFYLSVAFLVSVLSMIINDHFKKFVLYEDLSFSPLNAFPPLFPSSPPSAHHPCLQECSNNSNTLQSLNEQISPSDRWHSMDDEELMWRASMVPRIVNYPFNRTPKVAFLFLTKGRLPLASLWEMLFRGHEGRFSIYIHTLPDFTSEPDESSVFYKRRIPSKLVQWGKSTMIDAERRLLANALLDFTNERFVLLSETCIPLFNFSTIYDYLINSEQSFLSTFDDPRPISRGRYNKDMTGSTVELSHWRRGSQWFEANRELALAIVSDVTYYPVFKKFCMPPCRMDEHYLPNLVTKICPNMTSNRSITWTDWSEGGSSSHPRMIKVDDVTQGFLER